MTSSVNGAFLDEQMHARRSFRVFESFFLARSAG
jgi:hypothetical protein